MREFEFVLTYREGADELMDVFRERSGLRTQTAACFANDRSMWRVDHVLGPAEALDAVEAQFLDETTCNECLDVAGCDSTREYQVISSEPEHRVYFTRREEIQHCHSIPYLAVDHVGDGLLIEAERCDDEYVWRLLIPDDCAVGELYDRIDERLRDGISLELGHVSDPQNWNGGFGTAGLLTPEERETVAAAVRAGYYGTPRDATVADLADELDTPHSTVQYRLQRAEEKIVSRFASETL
ncbi:helix-turn-helix domain-containing protein [Halosimplex halophilum]|uniref:helix-turn-helix domain-containing protein n=1 Tax=Halosimplex halophilum TaxID=2559572 RepID=UPI00107F36DB|nr:helix-turn-helix domain-containing protein [Halosimplex halophilum]